jgi:signal transduction histidine kinase
MALTLRRHAARCRPSAERYLVLRRQSSLRRMLSCRSVVIVVSMARDLGKRFVQGARTWDRRQVVDVLVAVVFGVAGEVEGLIDAHGRPLLLAQGCLTGPLMGGLLLVRRKRPLLTMTVFTAVALLGSVVQAVAVPAAAGSPNQVVPLFFIMVASYSLGVFGSRRDLLLGLPQPLIAAVVIDRLQPAGQSIPGAVAFFAVFLVGTPALGGRLVRGRQRQLEVLAGQRRQLDVQRAMQTRTALAAERLQLAGRLDENLVAGMDCLQAEVGAAEREGQSAAVAAIETRARGLLAETRKVVVSLAAAGSAPGAPRPGTDLAGAGPPARTMPQTASSTTMTWTALAAAVVGTGLLLQVRAAPDVRVPMPVALLGCLVIAAPLAVAWRWPLAMTAALWSATALFSAFVTPLGDKFAAISLAFVPPFMVAYFGDRRRAAAGLGICCLGGLLCFGWDGFARQYDFVVILAAWIAGRVLDARSRLVEELRANNRLLAGQGEVSLRHAVAEERARIARDLHDSIGHHLTIIALQAGAARRLWTSDPPKARAALATVARVAAHGSAELKMGFGSGLVLAGDASPGTAPVTDITALLDNARSAGLPVNAYLDGDDPDLPGDTKLVLFRVLQEALTNVLRHAPGAAADVTVRTAGAQVELVVTNSAGDQPSTWAAGDSHGQRGMRQRVEEHGGRLEYGRRPDGGFEVRAWFPVSEST